MESLIVMGRYYTTFTVLFDDYRMMGFNIHKHSFVCVTSRVLGLDTLCSVIICQINQMKNEKQFNFGSSYKSDFFSRKFHMTSNIMTNNEASDSDMELSKL